MPGLEKREPEDSIDKSKELVLPLDKRWGDSSCLSKARDYYEPHRLPAVKMQETTRVPVTDWRPSPETCQEIDRRVQTDWHERPIEGQGVEAARQYLRDYVGARAIVASRYGGGADILALDRRGQLALRQSHGNQKFLQEHLSRMRGRAVGRDTNHGHFSILNGSRRSQPVQDRPQSK